MKECIHRCPFGGVSYAVGSARNLARTWEVPRPENPATFRSFPSALLGLVDTPGDAFALLPDPDNLINLDACWPERAPDRAAAVSLAIGSAFDAAMVGRPWVNIWLAGYPCGLWHWSQRVSADITPMNGGGMAMRWCWAMFDDLGMLVSLRLSRSPWASTPPGLALACANYPWVFVERPWDPDQEHEVRTRTSIDWADLPRPHLLASDVVDGGQHG